MSDDLPRGVGAYLEQTRRIIFQLKTFLENWPTSRREEVERFQELMTSLRHASILFNHLPNKYLAPLVNASYQSQRSREWLSYCQSWTASALGMSHIHVTEGTIGLITCSRELNSSRNGKVNNLEHIKELIVDCELHDLEHTCDGNRFFKDLFWRVNAPSALVMRMDPASRELAWRITSIAIMFVETLKLIFARLKVYCDRYAGESPRTSQI